MRKDNSVRIAKLIHILIEGRSNRVGITKFQNTIKTNEIRLIKNIYTRRIPIHPTLIELGFLNYLDRTQKVQKNAIKPMLFSDVRKTVKHGWGRRTEDWYNNSF